MGKGPDNLLQVSSDPDARFNNAQVVEEQLEKTCKKLNETEVNIRLFNKMVRNGVATNDVRNFVSKQAELKSMNHEINCSLTKKAMKSKFIDACALARKLRYRKTELKYQLITEFNYSKKKCRTLVKKSMGKMSNHRHKHRIKAMKKYDHCLKKMNDDRMNKDFKDIPERAWDILKGVNLFQNTNITPEPSADPMVCSPDISLSKAELAFLKKGPRYMLRQEMDVVDFKTELEKMSVKEKLTALNSDKTAEGSLVSDCSLSEEAAREEAKSAMIYIKSEKVLDLGRMKATDYKFNKHVYLPKEETTEKEALHEVRRLTMLDAFRETTKNKNNPGESKKGRGKDGRIESNLTRLELEGMKSLQKRVMNEEIIITETDKSKKFCVLTTNQYYQSGKKHTEKDLKISVDQVKDVQKTVNDHSFWLRRIFGLGAERGHEERIGNSMTDRGEVVAPLYLLVKDHKGWSYEDGVPPPPLDQSAVEIKGLTVT